jgi:hypothetical protein
LELEAREEMRNGSLAPYLVHRRRRREIRRFSSLARVIAEGEELIAEGEELIAEGEELIAEGEEKRISSLAS